MRPKLLFATIDFPPELGGIQRVVGELANGMVADWDVTVVAPRASGASVHDESVPFRVCRTRQSWADARTSVLLEMSRIAYRERADLLVAAHVNTLPSLVLASNRRPIALILYGSELWAPRTRFLTRVLGRRVTKALAISRFTAAEAVKAGIPPARISVTPLGADIPQAKPTEKLPDSLGLQHNGSFKPFLLSISRLTERHKGHDIVIRALPTILRHFPDVCYVVAGDGWLARNLEVLAEREGVAHAVRFVGTVDEPTKAALLSTCTAFVMVSRELRRPALFEGFGIVYIEAALAGRPSIAGASGGTADAVVDGETGLLVNPTSVSEVVAAILRLLDHPEYADRLGQQARDRAASNFTWAKAVSRMSLYFEAMIK